MCRLKTFSVSLVFLLCCIEVSQVGYFCYMISSYFEDIEAENFAISVFVNFSILFFILTLVVGIVQSNEALVYLWIVYAMVELLRSLLIICISWTNPIEEHFEKIFNCTDVTIQTVLIFAVVIIIKVRQKSVGIGISTIARSIETSERNAIRIQEHSINESRII